jgi:hypothetical protein
MMGPSRAQARQGKWLRQMPLLQAGLMSRLNCTSDTPHTVSRHSNRHAQSIIIHRAGMTDSWPSRRRSGPQLEVICSEDFPLGLGATSVTRKNIALHEPHPISISLPIQNARGCGVDFGLTTGVSTTRILFPGQESGTNLGSPRGGWTLSPS